MELDVDMLVPTFPISSYKDIFQGTVRVGKDRERRFEVSIISVCGLASHWAPRAASEQATYSASVVESDTVFCLYDFHEIGPL